MIKQGSPAKPFRSTGRHDGGHQPNVSRGIAQRRRRGVYRRPDQHDSDLALVLLIMWVVSTSFIFAGILFGLHHGFDVQMVGRSFLLTPTQSILVGSVLTLITSTVTVFSLKHKGRHGQQSKRAT